MNGLKVHGIMVNIHIGHLQNIPHILPNKTLDINQNILYIIINNLKQSERNVV